MRQIVLHRHAARYFQRMAADRQVQMRDAFQEVAKLPAVSTHPQVRAMAGDWKGCYRLRVGSYRAIFQELPAMPPAPATLQILLIGPRGDIYK